MRHHRKLLRRLRALFPVGQRRGVIVERMRGLLGGGWRVIAGRVVAFDALGRRYMRAGGCVLALESRRADALQDALRKRAREITSV